MTRHILVLFALLPLTSCIPVENFGTYWDKTTIDPTLAGSWRRVAASSDQTRDRGYPIGSISTLVEKTGGYEMRTRHGEKEPTAIYPARTLDVGPYRFLAVGPAKGYLWRYRASKGGLEFCTPLGPPAVDFVVRNYPSAVNVTRNRGEGEYVTINSVDDEVLAVLASIPDSDRYWSCDTRFERVK